VSAGCLPCLPLRLLGREGEALGHYVETVHSVETVDVPVDVARQRMLASGLDSSVVEVASTASSSCVPAATRP
jgi:hypothetical protein